MRAKHFCAHEHGQFRDRHGRLFDFEVSQDVVRLGAVSPEPSPYMLGGQEICGFGVGLGENEEGRLLLDFSILNALG